MRATTFRAPSQRDQNIYRLAAIALRPQYEVAQLYEVSQGRVSQICRQVREWLACKANEEITVGQDDYIAAHEMRVRLEEKLRRATDVFDASCQPEVVDKVAKKNNHLYCEQSVTRRGRPSHQMFRETVRLEGLIFKARTQEHALKASLAIDTSEARWWREETLVQKCLELCQEITCLHPSALRHGKSLSPLPTFDLSSLQAQLRDLVAPSDLDTSRGLGRYLPSEWLVLARELGMEEGETALPDGDELMDKEYVLAMEQLAREEREMERAAREEDEAVVAVDREASSPALAVEEPVVEPVTEPIVTVEVAPDVADVLSAEHIASPGESSIEQSQSCANLVEEQRNDDANDCDIDVDTDAIDAELRSSAKDAKVANRARPANRQAPVRTHHAPRDVTANRPAPGYARTPGVCS